MRQGGCKEPTNIRIVTTTYRAYLRRRELTSRRFPRPGASREPDSIIFVAAARGWSSLLAIHGGLLRGVRRYDGLGGLRVVRAPRGVLHMRRPPTFGDGRQEVLYLQDRLPIGLRH